MTAFPPIDSAMLDGVLTTFSKVASLVTGLLLLVVTVRVSLLAIQVSGPDRYFELLKDAVVFLLTISLLPFALSISTEIVTDLAQKFSFQPVQTETDAMMRMLEVVKTENFLYRWIADLISHSFLHVIKAIFSLLLGLTVSAIPLIMISEFTFGISIGIAQIGSILFALMMWPVFWNVMGLLAINMWPSFQATSLASVAFFTVVKALQVLSPLFCFSLLRSASPGAAVGAAASTASRVLAMPSRFTKQPFSKPAPNAKRPYRKAST